MNTQIMSGLQAGRLLELRTGNKIILGESAGCKDDVLFAQGRGGQPLPVLKAGTGVVARPDGDGSGCGVVGQLRVSLPGLWKIDQLERLLIEEQRNCFRQPLRTTAGVYCQEGSASTCGCVMCSVLDVSGGGLMLQVMESYGVGDVLIVCGLHVGAEEFTRLVCVVKWVGPGSCGRCRFGCQFCDVAGCDRDRLAHAIFLLNRQTAVKR